MPPITALLDTVAGVRDADLGREVIAALLFLCLFLLSAPRGRRQLAWWPIALLLMAPLPLAVSLLFPDSVDGPRLAVLGIRFFLLASLAQSVLLLLAVSAWERIGSPIERIFLDVLRWLMVASALLAILFEAGVRAENLFTGSAVVTAVLGFALKDTLGNVFAGLAIHAEHPFELGDWIQYDANPAHVGRVVEINWRATKVLTLDEAYVVIPNGQLAQASIRNFTKPDPWSRRSLFVVTPYEVSPQRVQRIILDAIRDSFGVLEKPPPSVVTSNFTERGVEHWVRLFTSEFDKRDRVDGMARDRIWFALARSGIPIPVATQSIRLVQAPPADVERSVEGMRLRVELLEGLEILDALPPEAIGELAAATVERVFGAGETIIREGDRGDSMFLLVEGRVEVTSRAGNGPAVTVGTLGAGDYVGEMSLMTGAVRTATVTALEETRVLEVGKGAFRAVLAAQPAVVEQLGAALRRRLGERAVAIAGADRAEVPEPQDLFRGIREFFGL
ncbi:MAG: hypothetical protein EBZ59_11105 [Planctomycetia bacterium]|nr:hypothetical protein [Planctomycetia bacterium]